MGVVIGETSILGRNVTLFQGVTLGGTGKETGKRHPTLKDNVVVGAGAKVLGNITVGENSYIGANAVVLRDVPANSTVVGVPGHVAKKDGKKVDLLDHVHVSDPMMQHMKDIFRRLKNLEDLSICGSRITNEGLQHLADLSELKILNLLYCKGVTDEGIKALSALTSLEELTLPRANLSEKAVNYLKGLTNLRLLKLSIGENAEDERLDLSTFKALEWLQISGTLNKEELAHLRNLTNLKRLIIGLEDDVTDEDMEFLSELQAIEILNLGGGNITDKVFESISQLKALRRLTISGNFSDKTLEKAGKMTNLSMGTISTRGEFSKKARDTLRLQNPYIRLSRKH